MEKDYLDKQKERFIKEAEGKSQYIFDTAKSVLQEAGVAAQAIETQFYPSIASMDVADDILSVATREKFQTVVVGRDSWSRLKETFRYHLCHELIRKAKGITVCVVQ
jgi:K+-sensing histidine kinase KdpD